MDEQREQIGRRESTYVSDEAIRLFLLCGLNTEERTRIEEQVINDDELDERMRLAESEIADDYAFGRLSANEQKLFARSFLVTDARKRKLEVSQALHSYSAAWELKDSVDEAKPAKRRGFFNLFGFDRPALVFATSFGALLLLIGGVWIVARKQNMGSEPAVVKQEPLTKPFVSPQSSTSPAPVTESTTPPTQKSPPVQPGRTVIAVLMPGALRDGGSMTRIALPKGERDIVRIQLTLESDSAGVYRAELLTDDGGVVSTSRGLKATETSSTATVAFDLPANRLKPGDYQIKLSRVSGRNLEGVGRYYFRAIP